MSGSDASTYDRVAKALMTGAADETALRAIMSLGGNVPPALEGNMLMSLSDTSDPRLRNALAIALAEAKSKDAIPRIIALMSQPKTAGARSTLLYALQKLNVRFDPVDLAYLILSEPPEAREEAFIMLEQTARYSEPIRRRAAAGTLLDSLLRSSDYERTNLIFDAVDILISKSATQS